MDNRHAARLAALTAFGALPASALNDTDDARMAEKHARAMSTAGKLRRRPTGEMTRVLDRAAD
jgi:hypothetical protein